MPDHELCLAGLPCQSYSVAGHDVVGEAKELRRGIGLSGQNAAVDEHLTGFAAELERIVNDPSLPVLANADAQPLLDAEACRAELVDHLTAGVDWVAAVERMAAAGVTTFIEVGPGRVLTGLIKRIAPDAETFALDDPAADDRLAVPFASPAPA